MLTIFNILPTLSLNNLTILPIVSTMPTKSTGIKLRLKKGDLELEIEVGSDVSEEQLKLIQKLIAPFATSETNRNERKSRKRMNTEETTYSRLKKAISVMFKTGEWFTSLDAKDVYEEIYNEEIETSTCSTYLRRMEREGFLESRRAKGRKIIEYRIRDLETAEVLAAKVVALRGPSVEETF